MILNLAAIARGFSSFRRDLSTEANIRHQEIALDRQAKVDAENRAQLLADGMDEPEGISEWGSTALREQSKQIIGDISKYMMDNKHDLTYTPEKIAELKRMKKSLINNPLVIQEMNFKTHRDSYMQFMAQNPDWAHDPSMVLMKQEIENYNKTGSTDGITENRKEFIFTPPHEEFNVTAHMANVLGNLKRQHTIQTANGGYIQRVDSRHLDGVLRAEFDSNTKAGRTIRTKWNNLSDEERENYKNQPVKWLREQYNGYVPEDNIVKGFAPSSNDSNSGARNSSAPEYFRQNVFAPFVGEVKKRNLFAKRNYEPKAIQDAIADKEGYINSQEGIFLTKDNKDLKSFPLGNTKGRANGNIVLMGATENSVPLLAAEYTVDLTIDQLDEIEDYLGHDIYNQRFFGGTMDVVKGLDEFDDIDIEENYQTSFTKIPDPDNPNKLKGVQVTLLKPLPNDFEDRYNASIAPMPKSGASKPGWFPGMTVTDPQTGDVYEYQMDGRPKKIGKKKQ